MPPIFLNRKHTTMAQEKNRIYLEYPTAFYGEILEAGWNTIEDDERFKMLSTKVEKDKQKRNALALQEQAASTVGTGGNFVSQEEVQKMIDEAVKIKTSSLEEKVIELEQKLSEVNSSPEDGEDDGGESDEKAPDDLPVKKKKPKIF